VVNEIDQLSAGLISMNELCNFNRETSSDLVINFFMLMEVYGAQSDLPFIDSLYEPTFLT